MEIYLQDDCYNALVSALANLQPCPVEGRVTEDQVRLTFGELGNIWPAAILCDILKPEVRIMEGR